ncbi:SusC/RagA family TonB-linked outer membrane protein [Pedobacter sp. KBW06]|uniref:SusC/RagA family TonB-linked outer membrane protein n=1 Tax=Pedobacter sp. KBW06 TaxID=2153359 RepID=UPI0018F70E50|nr:SusC/RagA family TonB-linked outer membrane protein [Pedobacter sp. KBW06]
MTKKALCFRHLFSRAKRISVIIMIPILCALNLQARSEPSQYLDMIISLKVSDMPLKEVFKKINRQTKISFVFNHDIVTDQEISIDVKSEKLGQVLQRILNPVGMDYSVSDDVILIRKKAMQKPEVKKPAEFPVTGVVTDQGGMVMPGVSVKVKGGTGGSMTNTSGQYNIKVPDEQSILVFSSVGFLSQEIRVNGRKTIDVKLQENANVLSDVVITALGVTRSRRALAYSVTEVKGDEFTQARENNVANALIGKVAGVNAAGISTGPGGSSRVVIRGNGSLSGGNQPLYVINGMPLENSVPGGSAITSGGIGNVDRGDGISSINPDDIESISVLKGGTAAALYGARAANGVILITTKKGKAQRGIGIEYNGTFTAETPTVLPDWQYEYGQGILGAKPLTKNDAIISGRRSWGAKIDGSAYIGMDGNEHPYSAQKDNIKHFYRTGTNFTNTLAFTGGTENLAYRFSLADLNSRSILPNSSYHRQGGNLSVNGKMGKRVSFEALVQYNIEKGKNRANAGDAFGNPNWSPYMIANTADIRWLKPGFDNNGTEIDWNDAKVATNSYFVVNKFKQNDTRNRTIAQAAITYEILKNLSVKGTVSRDFYNYDYAYITPTGTLYPSPLPLNELKVDASETNGLLSLNYNGKLGKDFNLTAFVGGNQQRAVYNQINIQGTSFVIPNFYSSTNATIATIPTNNRTAINSFMGSADLSFRSIAYLTVTGRQDWFSTLSPKNNTLFYPSVGGSFVLSEALKLPEVVNFAKLRASWAQVGGGAPNPYQINQAFTISPSTGATIQNVSSLNITNKDLKPYTSTTLEAGFEARFFNNRLGIDLTLYDRKTTNDIVQTTLSGTTGYNNVILNIGELSNKGVELLLNGTPVRSNDFSWNVSYNVAYNKNEVVKLAEGLTQIQLGTTVNTWAYINNVLGKPYGAIVGTRMARDASNNVIFGTDNQPVISSLQYLGNGVAPLTMGISNDFKYKNFSLNVLIDGKFGNKVFSVMEIYATRMGLMKSTLPGRENGLQLTGVKQDGSPYSYLVPVKDVPNYYDNTRRYAELFVHDAGFVKLRQVILSYNLPAKLLKAAKVEGASVSFVARNLFILYRKTKNFDPESSYTNGVTQGFESLGLPRTRSFGLNLMVRF